MKFGSVENPGEINFVLPPDHRDTDKVLKEKGGHQPLEIYVGCAKWNRQDLKNFYPRGTKDELSYYSTQFNCIELNATFYGMPTVPQVSVWKNKTPAGFKFFPKITDMISHYRRLIDVKSLSEEYGNAVSAFEEKLGMIFLQLHDNFKPKDISRVEKFIEEFPKGLPLAVEVRNAEWFSNPSASEHFFKFLEYHGVVNILVDTAGRRDMLHMRLTTPQAFVRYVGANHASDYSRLDEWVEKIKNWKEKGLEKLYFFVHQNLELESPLLSAHFIKKLNTELNTNLKIPVRSIAAASTIDFDKESSKI